MADDMTGKLLVASPLLEEPNFHRTVVYLCAHSNEGAFGLVINRPIEDARVGDHLPAWMEHVAPPSVFFKGGPVEPAAAFGLAEARAQAPAEGWLSVSGTVGLIDLSRPAEMAGMLSGVRLFSGYAGWAAGQLEGEIESEAWFVVETRLPDLFSSDPNGLWRAVLKRQPGKLAMFAHFPPEPGLN